MAIQARIRTSDDLVYGAATETPRDNGSYAINDGVSESGFTPRAHHIPSGDSLSLVEALNTRYLAGSWVGA